MNLLNKLFHPQTLYWLGVDWHLMRMRLLIRLGISRGLRKKPKARFLNIGCGKNVGLGEDWLNIDGFNPKADLLCDAARKLPFADNRFEGVFSEHVFEHFTPGQAKTFLGECQRILKPDGVIRIIVPDGELYVKQFHADRKWMIESRWNRFRTPMEVMNEVFRQGYEHQYTYDYETLALHLQDAGYADIRRESLKAGAIPELLIEQDWRDFESLYVEARKPGILVTTDTDSTNSQE